MGTYWSSYTRSYFHIPLALQPTQLAEELLNNQISVPLILMVTIIVC